MFQEYYLNKLKALPEWLRQFGGLVIVTLIIILSFVVLNNIFGEGDDLVKRMKIEEDRIAEERKLNELSLDINLVIYHFAKFLFFALHLPK